jgi:hypothetical protein
LHGYTGRIERMAFPAKKFAPYILYMGTTKEISRRTEYVWDAPPNLLESNNHHHEGVAPVLPDDKQPFRRHFGVDRTS